MTIPKSKVLSVSKGLMALADVKTGCPNNSQTVFVNITPNETKARSTPSSTVKVNQGGEDDKLKPRNAIVDGEELSDVVIVPCAPKDKQSKDVNVIYHAQGAANRVECEDNPYANITTQTRDLTTIDDAEQDIQTLQALLKSKDDMARALTLMLNLVEHNPLVVNKLIVAPESVLCELIKLLTSAEDVTITYLLDNDVGCSCGAVKYMLIDKIYVVKDGDTHVLKYSFPDATKLLDDHKISTKMVAADLN